MKHILLAVLLAAQSIALAGGSGLFAFDNAVGGYYSHRGGEPWPPVQQARTLKELGYDGISYNYTNPADIATWVEVCRKHEIKFQGLYVNMFPDREPAVDPAFMAAIPLLKGTDCVIWLNVRPAKDKRRNHDEAAVAVAREIADKAAANGLQVAIYPHFGFYVATAADAHRFAKLVDRPNVGHSLNLCHEFMARNGHNLDETIRLYAPESILVSLNGLNLARKHYSGRLDEGDFDLADFVRKVRAAGYKGPFGLQGYGVPGEPSENLRLSMQAWKIINTPTLTP